MDHLRAGVLVLTGTGERDRERLALGVLSDQEDRRVLHRDLRADVAVDPLHRRALVRDRALGDEVVDVVRPVLDRRVANAGVLLHDDLDDGRVQRVALVDRRRAALDVVDVRALVGDDQRPLELAHVLGVDAEVRLQRDVDVHARRHVDERSARPHRGVQRGELVVAGRDDRAEVLLEELGVLAQRRVGVHEDDTLSFELLVDLVVDDLGLVLRGDAGDQALTLGLGDAQALVRVADLFGKLFPRAGLLLGRAHEVLDVVEVDLAEVGAPGRHRLALEQLQALQAQLEHPLGFVLEGRDPAHDGLAQPALCGGSGGVFVVPAELVLSEARKLRVGRSAHPTSSHSPPGHNGVIRPGIPASPVEFRRGMPLGGPNQVAPSCAPTLSVMLSATRPHPTL